MKVFLPENISEITLGQYQEYQRLFNEDLTDKEFNRRAICIFMGITYEQAEALSQNDYEYCSNQITKALNTETAFIQRFKIKGVEFGFVPNLNDITASETDVLEAFDVITFGEFMDAEKYRDGIENIHKLMAVLFRPITKTDSFGNYEVTPYNGTKQWSEVMKQMPMNVVNGALFFFSSLSTELEMFILKYTREAQAREKQR